MNRTINGLPPHFQHWKRGACVPAVVTILPQLHLYDDAVMEGWVHFGNRMEEHTWLEINGLYFDPTIEQFKRFKNYQVGKLEYEVKSRIPVDVYISLVRCTMSDWWRDRIRSFGGEW